MVRGGRSCPLKLHLHRMRPDQPASQETRIRIRPNICRRTPGPRARTGTASQNHALRASNGKPATQTPNTNHSTGRGPGQARGTETQVNRSTCLNTSLSDGPDSDASLMKHSTEHRTVKFQIRTRSACCNNPGTILCQPKAAESTRTWPSPSSGRLNFATLRSLWSLHPFPTHVLLLLHLHATPLR